MEPSKSNTACTQPGSDSLGRAHTCCSGISWKAVIAGAFVSTSVALILISLGMGLGFSIVSPWPNKGVSATAIGVTSISWLIVTQAIAPSIGAYMAGRLRKKWIGVHTDEVFFRDTAHGFLVWAISLLLSFLLFISATTALISGTLKTGAMAASAGAGIAAAHIMPDDHPNPYLIDLLFRSPKNNTDISASKTEATRILINALKDKELPAADKTYLKEVIAHQLGISQNEAEKRIDQVMQQAQQAKITAQQMAETARKTAAHLSLWTFIALLIGAFCASYAATLGGRQRDCCEHS